MGYWKGGMGGGYRKPRRRSSSGHQKYSVPSWEVDFCYSTCAISWGKLLEAKKLMDYYQNIVQWDDSAGEEAFRNAKARYWADINQLPCDISLPNPDIFVDEVDWNSEIDPELLKDLDQRVTSVDEEEMHRTGWLSVGWDNPPPCTGWGDEDTIQPTGWDVTTNKLEPTGWGDFEDVIRPTGWDVTTNKLEPTGWGDFEDVIRPTGWDDTAEQSVQTAGWGDAKVPTPSTDFVNDNYGNNDDGWVYPKIWQPKQLKNSSRDNNWQLNSRPNLYQRGGKWENENHGPGNVEVMKNNCPYNVENFNLKNGGQNQYLSRDKVPRHHGRYDSNNCCWRNYGGRKPRGTARGQRWEVERPHQQLVSWQWLPVRSSHTSEFNQEGALG